MAASGPLLKLEEVSKSYEAPEGGAPAVVLEGITLEVAAGASLAIVGPSGSGKSTLLNIMGTLDRATSGKVLLQGRDLSALTEEDLARIRNRELGFVFQMHHLLPQLNVLENVLVPLVMIRDQASRREGEDRARRLLERVGLEARLFHRPGQLSGGEKQRTALVRALVNGPKLLLADEPTGSLDREASGNMGELLSELNRLEGVTLVVVTHALDVARGMDRILELRSGSLKPWEDRV